MLIDTVIRFIFCQVYSYRLNEFYRLNSSIIEDSDVLSIRYAGAKVWNDLLEELRNSPSKHHFKKL